MSGNHKRGDSSENRLDRNGSLSMTLQALRKLMHTDEIAEHIFQEFSVVVSRGSLATQLWRHVKKHPDSPFYKSKRTRNTDGLKERRLTATAR